MARVVLAMSGGVDSSVSAWLLREAGHEVIGLFMRHGQEVEAGCSVGSKGRETRKQGCCSASDAADARRVAELLGIPFYAVNFGEQFDRIVDHFVAEYTVGRTPNPCVLCNTWLKFGRLFAYADSVGAEYVATGHYARLVTVGGHGGADALGDGAASLGRVAEASDIKGDITSLSSVSAGSQKRAMEIVVGEAVLSRGVPSPPGAATAEIALCRGLDPGKDQSYVLFGIQRERLGRLKFPVGEHRKEEIRRTAGRLGLRVAEKADSQEICFVPDQDHARFVRARAGRIDRSGEIVTTDGTVVGRHDGIERFTVGQRKGLRVALGEPRYVVRIERESCRVVIGRREELSRSELSASGANWLIEDPSKLEHCQVKIRYRSRPVGARDCLLPGGRFHVAFDEPNYAIAPGQAAVCYDGDRLLGGGWID